MWDHFVERLHINEFWIETTYLRPSLNFCCAKMSFNRFRFWFYGKFWENLDRWMHCEAGRFEKLVVTAGKKLICTNALMSTFVGFGSSKANLRTFLIFCRYKLSKGHHSVTAKSEEESSSSSSPKMWWLSIGQSARASIEKALVPSDHLKTWDESVSIWRWHSFCGKMTLYV